MWSLKQWNIFQEIYPYIECKMYTVVVKTPKDKFTFFLEMLNVHRVHCHLSHKATVILLLFLIGDHIVTI